MFTNDRTGAELDPAANDALAQARKRATQNPDGLTYRVQENARCASVAVCDPALSSDHDAALNADVGEFDPYTTQLLDSLGDALGITRIELSREWHAADAKLLGRIIDLHDTSKNLERELKTLTASYENAQARMAELEQRVATLTETRIASLEKHTKVLVRALPSKAARIAELEGKIKALGDFDSRLTYIEALMSTMFSMPRPSRI